MNAIKLQNKIILAMEGKTQQQIGDIAKKVRGTSKINIGKCTARIRYQLGLLEETGIVVCTNKKNETFYTLAENTEMLIGKMELSSEDGTIGYTEHVGKVLRMMTEDGDIMLKLLEG